MNRVQNFLKRLGTTAIGSSLVVLLGLIVMFAAPGRVSAQSTTADLVGTVTDSTGAIVPGADITVTNKGTSEVRHIKSAGDGNFAVTLLPPGTYSVTVASASFKTFQISSITLAAGDKPRVDAKLEVGTSSETVTVEATTPLLQSESSTLQSSVNQQAVQDMPLNGRNFVQLVQMIPGANEGPPNALTNGSKPDDKRQSAAISANGMSDVLNNNMIDGIDNNERLIGSLGVRPSVDAISELHVQTSVYSADTGRTPGAAINIITKSGTNNFHGTAYEYFRNDIFNTYPYLFGTAKANFNNGRKLELRQNQFGGSLGGPIIKNKVFFFGDYEAFRLVSQANPGTSVTPSAYEETHPGDFSDLASPNNVVYTSGQLDAAALQYWKMFPTPNNGLNASGQGLFVGSSKNTQNSNVLDGKGVWQIDQNSSLAARYSYNRVKTYQPGALPTVQIAGKTANPNAGGGYAPDIAHSASLTYVRTMSQSLVLTAQAGYLRVDNEQYPAMFLVGNPPPNINAAIGQTNVNVDFQSAGLARAAFSNGGVSLGGAGNFYPLTDFSEAYQFQPSISYVHGAHSFKVGTQIIRRWATSIQSVNGAPSWTFPDFKTFIQGQYSVVTRSDNIAPPSYRWWEIGAYAQDDWHVSHNLTLNLGIRWDVYTNKVSPNNRLANWDNVAKKLIVAGTTGVSASTNLSNKYSLWSPRVGFAYTVRPGFVVRGGFGMSFFPTDITSNPSLKNQPFNVAYGPDKFSDSGAVPFATGGKALPTTVGSTTIANSQIIGPVRGVAPNFRPGEALQYNLSTQKDFHGNVVTIAYVGVLERHMPQSFIDINAPALGSGGNTTTRPNYATAPSMTTIAWYASEGAGMYNALQVSAERRLSNGISFSMNYSYAREQDNFIGISNQSGEGYGYYKAATGDGDKYERANSDLDLRNRMAATINYTLPFFKTATGFKGQALKGWQVNTLTSWAAGQPVTVTNSGNVSGWATGGGNDRPNLVGNPMLPAASRSVGKYFNTAAFAAQTAGTAGNAARNDVYGPHYRHVDLSLIKNFPIREGTNVEFRVEGFNILNTANFAIPGASRGSGTYGVINAMSAAYSPRLVQFAAKFVF